MALNDSQRELASCRVLLIDDAPPTLSLLRGILRNLGVLELQSYAKAEQALAVLESGEYKADLVLIDGIAGPLDGCSFTQTLRQATRPDMRMLPVVIVTGRTTEQEVRAAIEAGVSDYIVKPVSLDTVRRKLVGVMKDPRSLRERRDAAAATPKSGTSRGR